MEKSAIAMIHGNVARSINDLPAFENENVESHIDADAYVVYELVSGDVTQGAWSIALLEINSSPKHFHRKEKEVFTVVQGELALEIDGQHSVLRAGQSVTVFPGSVHKLKSARLESVRVLCVSFPAFDPQDMHCVE
jgi:mannose-6-phosphate isomerase-like protein (cupin superfamily)